MERSQSCARRLARATPRSRLGVQTARRSVSGPRTTRRSARGVPSRPSSSTWTSPPGTSPSACCVKRSDKGTRRSKPFVRPRSRLARQRHRTSAPGIELAQARRCGRRCRRSSISRRQIAPGRRHRVAGVWQRTARPRAPWRCHRSPHASDAARARRCRRLGKARRRAPGNGAVRRCVRVTRTSGTAPPQLRRDPVPVGARTLRAKACP